MNGFKYLWEKLPELNKIGNKDFQLSKLVARIHRKRFEVARTQISLCDLHPLHAIDRETALLKTKERAAALSAVKEQCLQESFISVERMNELLPSVSAVKVIELKENYYLAFEGNGRLYAFKEVFDNLTIEVDLYKLELDKAILRRVNRVLTLNNLSRP